MGRAAGACKELKSEPGKLSSTWAEETRFSPVQEGGKRPLVHLQCQVRVKGECWEVTLETG